VKQDQEQRGHLYLLLDLTFILERRHLLPPLLVDMEYLLDHHLIRLDRGKRKRLWVLLIKLVSRSLMDGADSR
jgi:hypothetical protein